MKAALISTAIFAALLVSYVGDFTHAVSTDAAYMERVQ